MNETLKVIIFNNKDLNQNGGKQKQGMKTSMREVIIESSSQTRIKICMCNLSIED